MIASFDQKVGRTLVFDAFGDRSERPIKVWSLSMPRPKEIHIDNDGIIRIAGKATFGFKEEKKKGTAWIEYDPQDRKGRFLFSEDISQDIEPVDSLRELTEDIVRLMSDVKIVPGTVRNIVARILAKVMTASRAHPDKTNDARFNKLCAWQLGWIVFDNLLPKY